MRLSPVCSVSTTASGPSRVAVAAGILFGSLLVFGRVEKMSRQVITTSGTRKTKICSALLVAWLRVSIFCIRRALRRSAATGCSHGRKILDRAKKNFAHLDARRSLQRRRRYRLFESKFDRDRNFETPVAIFVLQVE